MKKSSDKIFSCRSSLKSLSKWIPRISYFLVEVLGCQITPTTQITIKSLRTIKEFSSKILKFLRKKCQSGRRKDWGRVDSSISDCGEMYWIQLHIKFSHSSLVLSGVLQDITEILLKMASNTHVYIWWKQWTHYYNSKVTRTVDTLLQLQGNQNSGHIITTPR